MLMIKNVTIDRDTNVQGLISKFTQVNLSYYAEGYIFNYRNVSEIPKENMDYINSVKYAVKCRRMFSGCRSLRTLDLLKFNTSYVTDMEGMFNNCNLLNTLNLSNFNTSNVTNMGVMFSGCSSLTTIDLSNFDTSHVTTMGNMFSYDDSLISLNLSTFNTSKVTYMNDMFYGCTSLSSLNISNWDTSKVTTMGYMFTDCISLTMVKGTPDLSSCTSVHYMFYNTPNLRNVHLKNVPRSLIDTDGSLKGASGTLNKTYIIDNILEGK